MERGRFFGVPQEVCHHVSQKPCLVPKMPDFHATGGSLAAPSAG